MDLGPEQKRFLGHVEAADCWEWRSALFRNGYGAFVVRWGNARGHRTVGAHRYSWFMHRGMVPAGKWVLHHCDNKGCVNPEHLYLGTAKNNFDDMVLRGRARYACALTDGQVEELRIRRAAGEHIARLAEAYNISVGTVSRIAVGRSYTAAAGPVASPWEFRARNRSYKRRLKEP